MDREQLEKAALRSVCGCWYYELNNSLAETDSADLERVIANPMWFHINAQLYDPDDVDRFLAEYDFCVEQCVKGRLILIPGHGGEWPLRIPS